MKIGVAGFDKMGTAIAKLLIDVGHDVIVWNRSPETKQLALAGAASAASPATLAREVEAVITILTDADAIKGGPNVLKARGAAVAAGRTHAGGVRPSEPRRLGRTRLHTVAGLLGRPEQLMSEMDAHRV